MEEEIIISGRLNEKVDPLLHIWGWEIAFYLFAGGLAAGLLFFASLSYLRGKENDYTATVKWAPLFAPILLVLGLGALFLDLHHKLYFWRLYTTIKLQSPMSWGAWTLMVITPLSIIWCATFIRDIYPNWDWKFKFLYQLENFFIKYRKVLAWIMVSYSAILGIYTGILLSAFNARPLWNTSILGPLFLASGLSAGAAVIVALTKSEIERKFFSRIDLIIIGVELFFIIHMFMGFLASTQVQIEAAQLFLGGSYTLPFWIFVVFIGMLVPALLEYLELKGQKIPVIIPVALILFGNVMLRFIIVYAGQASRYLY
ncbi:NrfD/PsrC family molybdoenzyme membrane anchor subunit [Chondrinema litorale]|uniref:NrfD/PsrC family molybdoenzyme membrane anchor subunit n=1 Tax=Chondrinema litorale TaxID=2994555 RepID=UPI002542DEF0|nr:NrfD/PsrC family molybdoenzyme membrane anchor subunit [Chondrinema litorale]UZR97469.1 polysulfide reductase NrfD [Chondrinema litorale]